MEPNSQNKERKKLDFPISLPEILNVQRLIYDSNHIVHRSNLTSSNQLCEKYQAKIFLKREFQQKGKGVSVVGKTHKIRGSYYKYVISQKDPRSKKGFVCASDGNFAQSLSIIAGVFKVKCVLFIPSVCNKYKLENMKRFGGQYLEFKMLGDCFETAVDQAKQFAEANQMIFMHPFDDLDVITGYTSLAQQIKEDCEKTIDYLFVPSGGGGLLSAIILYFKQLSPQTKIVCVEPEGANPMYQSIKNNQIVSVQASRYCDGSSVKQIGQLAFQICKDNVDVFTTVTEGQISESIIDLYTKGIISEPSGAMSVAALQNLKEEIKGKTVVCLISGANTDLSRLDEAQEKSMIFKGFKNYYLINLPNQAGIITTVFDKCLHQDNTITSIQYKRKLNKEESQFLIGVESKSQQAADFMDKKLVQMNFKFENINLKENILELLF